MKIIRDITLKLKKYLDKDEILLIIGARQVGKTTVLYQLKEILENKKKVCYFLNLEDRDYLSLINDSPKNIFKIFPIDFKNRNYIFIDEIQYLNDPSNFLKYIYDEYKDRIRIIASGSSAFYLDTRFTDSLAGRKRIFNLYTLSFQEFLRFKNEEVLSRKLFENPALVEREKIIIYYQEYLRFGGYPRVVLADGDEEKIEVLRDIAYSYIKKDIYDSNIRQDEIFYKLFKILSNQIGGLVNNSELASTLSVSRTAIDNYLYVMRKSFHICNVLPFYRNIRKELTRMPKIYFMDLGLRNFFKGNFDLYHNRDDKGMILENALFRQLIEKYEPDQIKFWRTIQKKEIDFIIDELYAYESKTQIRNIKLRDYRLFLETYPDIKFQFVSFENKQEKVLFFPVIEVWQI
ncbi:MAG: ATP-binding protein [Candidatus Hydrogenedentota bacterium]